MPFVDVVGWALLIAGGSFALLMISSYARDNNLFSETRYFNPETGRMQFCKNSEKRCSANSCKCWDIEQEKRRTSLEKR
jgi:hypothetical protein